MEHKTHPKKRSVSAIKRAEVKHTQSTNDKYFDKSSKHNDVDKKKAADKKREKEHKANQDAKRRRRMGITDDSHDSKSKSKKKAKSKVELAQEHYEKVKDHSVLGDGQRFAALTKVFQAEGDSLSEAKRKAFAAGKAKYGAAKMGAMASKGRKKSTK